MAGSFIVLAILNNVIPFSLIFAGQTEMGAGLASVLNATTPFWTILVANAVTQDEKFSRNKVLGILLGILGTAVMVGPGVLAGLGGPVWPKFALIGASLSYAFAVIFARRFKALPPVLVAAGQLTASTFIMIPVVLAWSGPSGLFAASPPVWAAVLRAGAAVHRLRLHPLLRPGRPGRRHQRLAGHPGRAGQRPASRLPLPRRAPRTLRGRRHAPDRARPRDD